MWERILLSLATSLFERLGKWLSEWYVENQRQEAENERIGDLVGKLIDSETVEEIRDAFNNLA